MNMFNLNEFKNSNSSQAAQPKSKAELTRAQILSTALGLFREKGFDTTTMRDIASACGMAVGTAYHHFDSKEAIVAAYYEAVQLEHSVAQCLADAPPGTRVVPPEVVWQAAQPGDVGALAQAWLAGRPLREVAATPPRM